MATRTMFIFIAFVTISLAKTGFVLGGSSKSIPLSSFIEQVNGLDVIRCNPFPAHLPPCAPCESGGQGCTKTIVLQAKKDVWLEGRGNKNGYNFLIVGKHPQYPKKRTLIQFEDLSEECCKRIKSAKMYLYFWYAHKASWMSERQCPSIPRTLRLHQMKRDWKENEATTYRAKTGSNWNAPYVALDNSDAARLPIESKTLYTSQTKRYIEFDITKAARNWWISGNPNYGLLIWATNENVDGRGFRFYSRERSTNKPYVRVECGA